MGRVILKKRASPANVLSRQLVATCPGGAEAVLAAEMQAAGFEQVQRETGAVRATRSETAGIATANRSLRTAARVLIPVQRFTAADYDEVYQHVSAIPWERLLPTDRTFAISATTRSQTLSDHRYLAMRTKDAIVDRQRAHTNGVRSSVDRDHPDLPVVIFANDREIELSLDSSGAPLHERGYRTERGEAPLRETVAAMMLLTARWPDQPVLVDPFCGSGTIPIEAALISRGLPPGSIGRRYAYQRWTWMADFDAARGETDPGSDTAGTQRIIAADSDPQMIEIARRNAERAGVADQIEFFTADVTDTIRHVAGEPGVVVTNPPYGRRLQPEDTARLYRAVGDAVRRHLSGWDIWMLLGDPAPVKTLGLTPDQRLSVFNGGLPVKLCRYRGRGGS